MADQPHHRLGSYLREERFRIKKSKSNSQKRCSVSQFIDIVRQAVNCNHAEETFGARAETPRISPRGPHRLGAGTRCNRRVLGSQSGMEAIDDGRGRTGRMRGVPGATWLALMSYPIWTTTAAGKKPRTSGWHLVGKGRRSIQELRLPLWVEPLGPLAIKALVEHPELDGDLDVPLNQKIRLLGIFHVCRARRAPSEHSAGLLIPAQR